MALLKNGIDFSLIVESVKTDDIRQTVDFIANKARFIKPFTPEGLESLAVDTDFKIQDTPISFAKKGCRPLIRLYQGTRPAYTIDQVPAFAKGNDDAGKIEWFKEYMSEVNRWDYKYEIHNPGTYYIVKFSDKTVRLCTTPKDPTSTPTEADIIMSEAINDTKIAVIEMLGGGGGGSYGRTFTGCGGAAGGYLVIEVNLEHPGSVFGGLDNNTPIVIGDKGQGGQYNKGETDDPATWVHPSLPGTPTTIKTDKIEIIASGGGGAQHDKAKAGAAQPNVATIPADCAKYIKVLHMDENGYSGSVGGTGGFNQTTVDYHIIGFAPTEENQEIHHPSNETTNAVAGRGTGTAFGKGPDGRAGVNPGYAGQHPGCGGGGGAYGGLGEGKQGPGGDGAPGLAVLYW